MNRREAIEYLEGIPEGEPVFVLRAQDRFMASIIRRWSDLVEASSLPESKGRAKAESARVLIREVAEWQETHPSKVPD